jgi:hypothetical protein
MSTGWRIDPLHWLGANRPVSAALSNGSSLGSEDFDYSMDTQDLRRSWLAQQLVAQEDQFVDKVDIKSVCRILSHSR